MKKLLTSTALMFGALAVPANAGLTTPGGASGTIQYSVAVCNPNSPFRCAAPDASGNLPVTLSGSPIVLTYGRATTAAPTYVNGTDNPFSLDLAGNLRTSLLTALPAGSNTIGAVTQASGPWTSNVTQFGSSNVVTGTGASGAGIPRITVSNDSAVSINASENHIGEVGSNHIVVKNAMTTSNNTVTTGKSIGGLQTIANAVRVSGSAGAAGTGGFIQTIGVNFTDAVTGTALDVYYFDANPTGSTCTDNAAFVLATADIGKVINVVHVGDFTSGNTAVTAQANNLAISFTLASSTTLYACVVARASFAITSTSNATLVTQILRD